MDLKEAKKLIAYARKQGIKTLKAGDIEVTFRDDLAPLPRTRASRAATPTGDPMMVPPKPPTLEEINAYIYGNSDDEAQSA